MFYVSSKPLFPSSAALRTTFMGALLAVLIGPLVSVSPSTASAENTVAATINLGTSSTDRPRDFEFSADGSLLYVATDRSVRVLDVTTNTVTATVPFVSGRLEKMVLSADGNTLYVADTDEQEIEFIDTGTLAVGTPLSLGFTPADLVLNQDGSLVYIGVVPNIGNATVRVMQTSNNTLTGTSITLGAADSSDLRMGISPDGATLYVPNNVDGTVSVINTSTNTVSTTVTVGSEASRLVVSPDGSRVYVSNNGSNSVSVIETAGNTVEATITGVTSPMALAVTPDGDYLYVGQDLSSNHTVAVIDLSDNSLVASVAVGDENRALTISSDGSTVYVANYASSPRSITVIERVLSQGASGSSVSAEASSGIFLYLRGKPGLPVDGSVVSLGAVAISPNAPYRLSIAEVATRSTPRTLAEGRVNPGGHLEQEVSLGSLRAGQHRIVLTSVGRQGESLILVNLISVDANGRFVTITPEDLQPTTR